MSADRVLLLASDLGASDAAGQLALLAPRLPAEGITPVVAVLGRDDTPAAAALRAAGVAVHAVPLRSAFDPAGWRNLRTLVAAVGPRAVHAWGPAAVRVGRAVTRWGGPPLVASGAADPGGGFGGWLTALALRRADRVVAATWAEAERYRGRGVCGDNLTRIPPGVGPAPEPPARAALLAELGLPPHARYVAAAGGLKEAIWTFDLVRYAIPDAHLVALDAGAGRPALEAFGRSLAFDDFRVCFAGPRVARCDVFAHAEAVLVLRRHGGVAPALAAMAAGKPVVGWANADLAEVVAEGETGRLVPVGDKGPVSAALLALLADPGGAARLGTAGNARAAERFPAARMAAPHARVYHELPRR